MNSLRGSTFSPMSMVNVEHRVLERDALERALFGVHGRFPQLMRVHFTKTFEARNIDLRVRIVAAQLGGNGVALLVREGNALRLAACQLEKRRHRGIDIAVFDERAHIAEEER